MNHNGNRNGNHSENHNGNRNQNLNGNLMEKQLLKDIESDNQQIGAHAQDGGLWTGDLDQIECDDNAGSESESECEEQESFEDDDDAKDLEVVPTADGSEVTGGNTSNGSPYLKSDGNGGRRSRGSKEEEVQLFDNRYTDDGLNDDFDGLRDRDPFE